MIKSIRIKSYLYKQFCQVTKPAQGVIFHQKFKEKLQKSNSHSKSPLQRSLLQSILKPIKKIKKIWYSIKTLIYTKTSN